MKDGKINQWYHLFFQWVWKNFPVSHKLLCHKELMPWKSVVCDGPGFKIRIRSPRTSSLGRTIYLWGMWEPEMTHIAQEKIQEGWRILDIGADIGYYSLLYASKCGPQGSVAAFEPDPEPWPILNDNIARHGLPNIRAYAMALSDHRGHGMMKLGGRGQMYPDQEKDGNNTNTVEMIPLDEYWPQLAWNQLDLVKIDVEGAEMSILKGMKKVLEEYHPHILLEIHPRQLKEIFHSSADEVMSFLTEKYPYRLMPVDADTLEIPKNGNLTVWGDWVE